MSDDDLQVIDVEAIEEEPKGREGDGGAYLVIADDSEEFMVSLRYAALKAKVNRSKVIIAYIIHIDDFVHWDNLENMMRDELREQAEKFLWNVSEEVNKIAGHSPSLHILEGDRHDEIVKITTEDKSIRALILGGKVGSSNPGTLVSYFTGKGFSRLHVPVMIVPSDLEDKGFRH